MRISKEGKGESCSVQSSCAALLHKTNNNSPISQRIAHCVRSYQDALELPNAAVSFLLPLLLSQLYLVLSSNSSVRKEFFCVHNLRKIFDSTMNRRLIFTMKYLQHTLKTHSLPCVWWQSLRPRQEKLSEVKFPILEFSYVMDGFWLCSSAACEKNS